MTGTTTTTERHGFFATLRDIYHERTNFNIVGRSRWWAILSAILIGGSILALVVGGLNLGIDFEGGSQWDVNVQGKTISIDDVRDALAGTQAEDADILVLTGQQDSVRVQTETLPDDERDAITRALAAYAGVEEDAVSFVDVGPTWGEQVTRKAVTGLIVMLLLIAAYLSFRFEWRMALAALLAVLHDIVITVGIYAVTGFEVTPATVIAFLTILGFSLYDTVVVLDKVKENTPALGAERGDTYAKMVNRSLNQVLMRSINTSLVALLPVVSLLVVGSGILGATTLRDFALALFIGIAVGAYSSIFVATPLLAFIKEREPRYAALRERAMVHEMRAAQEAPGSAPATVGAATPAAGEPEEAGGGAPPARETRPDPASAPPAAADRAITPRPRRQRRRKRR